LVGRRESGIVTLCWLALRRGGFSGGSATNGDGQPKAKRGEREGKGEMKQGH